MHEIDEIHSVDTRHVLQGEIACYIDWIESRADVIKLGMKYSK